MTESDRELSMLCEIARQAGCELIGRDQDGRMKVLVAFDDQGKGEELMLDWTKDGF